MTKQINEPIKIIEIDYDEWKVYEMEDGSYEYWFKPDSIVADCAQKITIKYNEERKMYDFIAEDYCEAYGSGGWSRWVNFSNEIRDTFLADAMQRIGK